MEQPLDHPPPELKPLLPFVQRANELRTADPVIVYWSLYYAAQLGIAANAKEQSSKLYLLSLMDTLEALKARLAENDAVTNDTASAAYVENFALKVFVAADNQDRAAKATRATAKRFLAASNFIELLKIFGELESEMHAKLKYAKWKAADIAKAFKQGRTPQPGPASGDPNQEAAQFHNAIAAGLKTDEEKQQEEDYLAREMAKLTAPDTDANADADASDAIPQAISSVEPAELKLPNGTAQNRRRATSKARMSLNMEGSPLPSPNFSKPLQPQFPRPNSAAGNSATGSLSPVPPSTLTIEGDHTRGGSSSGSVVGGEAPHQWIPSPPNSFVERSQPEAASVASSSASTGLPHLAASPAGAATSSSVLSGSRPLPVPPHRDGLPIPPAARVPSGASLGGRGSPSSNLGSGACMSWLGAARGLPSAPVSPGFASTPDYGSQISSNGGGFEAERSPTFDPAHAMFPATPLAPPALVASEGSLGPAPAATAGMGHSMAPIVHYAVAPSAPQLPASAGNAAAAASMPASAPAAAETKLPETLSLKLSTRVQKLAKSAASAVDFEDLDTARFQLRQALDILEGRTTE